MLKPRHSELQYTINEKSVLKKLAPIYYLSQKLETLFLLSLSEMRVEKKASILQAFPLLTGRGKSKTHQQLPEAEATQWNRGSGEQRHSGGQWQMPPRASQVGKPEGGSPKGPEG